VRRWRLPWPCDVGVCHPGFVLSINNSCASRRGVIDSGIGIAVKGAASAAPRAQPGSAMLTGVTRRVENEAGDLINDPCFQRLKGYL